MNRKKSILSDLIAITAHYDTSTLITKNGELVQILSIRGFSKRFDKTLQLNLRNEVRKILKSLISKDIMFYLYVKRDYRKIDVSKEFTSEFARMKHEIWIKENALDSNLMNKLYIAVVHMGAKQNFSKSKIFQQLFFNNMRSYFVTQLEKCSTELSKISVQILQSLEKYGVELLSLVESNGKLISQPLSFIYYLLFVQEKEIEVKKVDFAKILSFNLNITNDYNAAEVIVDDAMEIDFDGNLEMLELNSKSHKISMLTLKSGYDLLTRYTDEVLNLNQKMIITETIKLSTSDTLSKKITTDKKLYDFMKLKTAIKLSDSILTSIDKPIKSQVSIKIIGDIDQELERNVSQTKSLLKKIGISFIVEDLYMISSFFSILPGNSHLLRREFMNIMEQSAIFCSIKPKSLGRYNGSIWGMPITIFRTTDNLPFFFNFHNFQNIGHTIVVGKVENGLNSLVSLLISESFRFDPKVIDLFCSDKELDILYKSLNSSTTDDLPSVNLAKILNYNLDQFYKIIEFILFKNDSISQELKEQITDLLGQVIEKLKIVDVLEKTIAEIVDMIPSKIMNSDIQKRLIVFFSIDIYFKFFYKEVSIEKKFFKYNLNDLIPENNYKIQMTAVLSFFIIQKIAQDLNEVNVVPIIINISSDLLSLLPLYKDEINGILDLLTKKHAVVIFNCIDKHSLYKMTGLSQVIEEKISVKIFLSDKFVDRDFKNIFSLSYLEINKIKMYNPLERIFLMKQDDYSISCSFRALKINKN